MHIVMVLTSHNQLGATGKPAGLWLEAITRPFYIFRDAGADVTLASPGGGQPPVAPASGQRSAGDDLTPTGLDPEQGDAASQRFLQDPQTREQLARTLRLSEIVPDLYDALFFPDGYGAMWDLSHDDETKRVLQAFDAEEKPIGAVGHGAAALAYALGGRGRALVANRKLTAFTDEEEASAGLSDVVPFSLETVLRHRGALFQQGPDREAFCVSDGNLVTGQNPASASATALALLQLLGH